jgi:chromosome segregation ATPase
MAAAVQAPIGTATPVIMQFQAAMREKEILTAQLAQAYTIIDQLNSRLQADKQELGDRSAAQARSLQAQVALLQEAARANEKERRNLDVEVQSLHFRVQKLQSQLSARDGIENRCRDLESTIAELEYQNARISAEATALRSREPESDASAPLVFSLRNENEALRTQNGNLTNQLLEARTQYDVLMGQLKDVSRGPGVK